MLAALGLAVFFTLVVAAVTVNALWSFGEWVFNTTEKEKWKRVRE